MTVFTYFSYIMLFIYISFAKRKKNNIFSSELDTSGDKNNKKKPLNFVLSQILNFKPHF